METVKVLDSFNEVKNIKTIRFNFDGEARSGQFVMLWLPGIDEIPMSLSYLDGPKGITAENVGTATEAIHELRPGDGIGIRGPYGNGFDLSGDNFLVVGGGTGMAPLAPALEALTAAGKEVTCLIGARSRSDLLFLERASSSDAKLESATDDGSAGHHGFVTELARIHLEKGSFSNILTCGPEPMLAAMTEMAREFNVPVQCSLERYMKCGIGICGSCQLGKYTVCRDGPVFDGEALAQIEDFGKWRRAASGKKVEFQ